jgi:hypothetical protein
VDIKTTKKTYSRKTIKISMLELELDIGRGGEGTYVAQELKP